jgi:ketosteroid isomerase-like protein
MSTAQQSMQPIQQAMAATNDLFNREVFGNRNFAALRDIYTRDASILPPGAEMISSREAIQRFWTDLVQSASATSAILTSVDVMPAGDGAVEIGKATLTLAPPGQAQIHMEVKYVVYWREEDDRWKWQSTWNPNS